MKYQTRIVPQSWIRRPDFGQGEGARRNDNTVNASKVAGSKSSVASIASVSVTVFVIAYVWMVIANIKEIRMTKSVMV